MNTKTPFHFFKRRKNLNMGNTPGVQKYLIDEEYIHETFCSICLDDKNNMVIPYDCQHSYCSDCIKQWNRPCPLCRSNFTNTNTNTNTNFTTISQEIVNGFLQNHQKSTNSTSRFYTKEHGKKK